MPGNRMAGSRKGCPNKAGTERVPRSFFKSRGKRCDWPEAIAWAAENLAYHKPDYDTCPGPMALTLYLWANSSPASQDQFIKIVLTKLVPAVTERTSADDRFRDNGSEIAFIDEVRRMAEEAERSELRDGPEGAGSDPSAP